MKTSRRTFLKAIAATGLSPSLLGVYRAMADTASDPNANFVLFRVHGSMDSTLGLHPHLLSNVGIEPQDLFLGYDPLNDVFRQGNLTLGPSAAAIQEFANRMAIVRGIYVGPNDLGHPFAIQHMTAGRTQESAPSWTSYFGDLYARDNYIVTNAALQRGTMTQIPTLLTSVLRSQAADAAKPGSGNSGLSLYKDSKLGVNHYLDFLKQTNKLGKFMEVFSESQNKNSEKVPDQDLALASLYSGLSRVVQIDLEAVDGRISLDTHRAHADDHSRAQTQRWELIGGFLRRLQELNLFDNTLVVVITEFNRTPGLNDSGGKDHNYSDNAMALFGRRVRGGTVLGDRKLWRREDGFPYAYWAGSHIDFESGTTVRRARGESHPASVRLIHPGDVWKTIANSFSSGMLDRAAATDFILPRLF